MHAKKVPIIMIKMNIEICFVVTVYMKNPVPLRIFKIDTLA